MTRLEVLSLLFDIVNDWETTITNDFGDDEVSDSIWVLSKDIQRRMAEEIKGETDDQI